MPQEHHLAVPRTARYFTLGADGDAADQVWIACHGYAQLGGRFLDRLSPLDDGRRLVVAPEGLSRFYVDGMGEHRKVGASWMTREDRLSEIADYVGYLDAVHDEIFARVDRAKVTLHLLGFSQGTATATRWALRGKAKVDRLILWSGLLPPDALPDAEGAPGKGRNVLGDLDLLLVLGERDSQIAGAALGEQRAALDEAGIRYRLLTFPGGHRLDTATLQAIAAR